MTSTLIKRIALPVAMLVVVGAAAVASTGAFFSDTETSTGNTFTAGAIDLQIDSEQHYNGNVCTLGDHDNDDQTEDTYAWVGNASYPVPGTECTGSWTLKDLDDNSATGDKFFNFDDIKPGDFGENTISIHIETNDAYMCASLKNVTEADNGQTEPEDAVDTDGDAGAELDDVLTFFAWVDDGDNIYEPQNSELALGTPTAASSLVPVTWALADSTVNGGAAITAGSTQYLGVAWCAGDMTVNHTDGTITCDGSTVDNASQTDSWATDIEFYIEQARNNTGFECNPTT